MCISHAIMALSITKSAAVQLIRNMEHHGVKYVRFGARSGGCNGFQYELTPIERPEEGASTIPVGAQHTVELCMKSELFLFGTEIDYETDFIGQRFTFNNPNSQATCGCGATFAPNW